MLVPNLILTFIVHSLSALLCSTLLYRCHPTIHCTSTIIIYIYMYISHIILYETQFWVSILLTKQPFLISGIEDYDKAKDSALGAMGLFAVTLVYSIYKVYNPTEVKEEIEAQGMEGYQLNTGATSYGTR